MSSKPKYKTYKAKSSLVLFAFFVLFFIGLSTLNASVFDEDEPKYFAEHLPYCDLCKELNTNQERDTCTRQFITKHIAKNFNLYRIKKRYRKSGRIILQFEINKDGIVEHVKVIKGINKYSNQEAIRCVELLPKFEPGYNEDNELGVKKYIRIIYSIPIHISVT